MEATLYECTEHLGIRTARGFRYLSLLTLFLIAIICGILLLLHFPTSVNCQPSFIVQGLAILFLILSCCTCTQTICYWYDANQVVTRTSTQEVGDFPLTSGPPKATTKKEVFGGIDIGHKVCTSLSSCWQMCGFLSCFGIGLALMTGINSDGSVVEAASNNSDTAVPTVCDGAAMYYVGLCAFLISILFFITLCWRICRDPHTLLLYRPVSNDVNASSENHRRLTEPIAASNVELQMSSRG